MKETLKGILENTIDEKKYIFNYPIISYRYYDQAKFLHISDEEIGKEYNVDEDIVRYNEEDSKGYTKKIYIVGGLFQKEKKEMYAELKKIREFAKENNIKEIALELPVKYVLENNIRELKKYGIKEIILSVISTEDEILEKNGLMYNYRDITKAVFKIAISFMRLSLSMIIDELPFKRTGAQLRTLEELERDLERELVTERLIQGDVGSRKNYSYNTYSI